VAKAHPNDRDAKLKFTECSKIVKRIAFEKAISVTDTKKSVVDQINLESMSMFFACNVLIFLMFKANKTKSIFCILHNAETICNDFLDLI